MDKSVIRYLKTQQLNVIKEYVKNIYEKVNLCGLLNFLIQYLADKKSGALQVLQYSPNKDFNISHFTPSPLIGVELWSERIFFE